MPTYGQFCPVAKAMEVLDERWTLLVVRELLSGSSHFNELRRGVPKMSPALLSKRLHSLERAGVIRRTESDGRTSYTLTESGRELGDVVDALAVWGVRWIGDLGDEDFDPTSAAVGHAPQGTCGGVATPADGARIRVRRRGCQGAALVDDRRRG